MVSQPQWQRIVTDDGSCTLRHPAHQETYHSTFGALTESLSVFLQNSRVYERLHAGIATRVLEIGFGTGLNFMVTADAADKTACMLDYVAVEIEPLAEVAFSELLAANFPHSQPLVAKAISAVQGYTVHVKAAANTTVLTPAQCNYESHGVALTDGISFKLIIGDALTTDFGDERFDAIYLDAFSPKNNPDLWAPPFLKKMRQTMADDALLVSYCVSRQFRDSLTSAGYQWRKVKGPPGKREVLIASPG